MYLIILNSVTLIITLLNVFVCVHYYFPVHTEIIFQWCVISMVYLQLIQYGISSLSLYPTVSIHTQFLCCIRVFEECRKVVPLEAYVKSCTSDVCSSATSGCTSLQAFASACAKEGVCVDWRSSTNGECGKVTHVSFTQPYKHVYSIVYLMTYS